MIVAGVYYSLFIATKSLRKTITVHTHNNKVSVEQITIMRNKNENFASLLEMHVGKDRNLGITFILMECILVRIKCSTYGCNLSCTLSKI